jgi:gamma-glutamylcyclotransferase (GGCT)/AIG2-like uncharacterized protein YtfP
MAEVHAAGGRAGCYLFVYGTLRPGAAHPMAAWLAARAELVGAASTPGRLYDLGAYPGLVPGADAAAGRVAGDVYRLAEPEALLARLDEYEGCGERDRHGAFRREQVIVRLAAGARLAAWTYVHRGPLDRARAIPSGDYAAWLDGERRGGT